MSWFSALRDWASPSAEVHDATSAAAAHDAPPLPDEFIDHFNQISHDLGLEPDPAHLERNQYQDAIVPDHLPHDLPYYDPSTSVTWVADDKLTESIWHGADNDCIRGELPASMVTELRDDPHYRDDFAHVAAGHDYNVDEVVPGAQACYGPDGSLVENGPHQGTWDFASPATPDQTWTHFNLDVRPDASFDNYSSHDVSDHSDAGSNHGFDGGDWNDGADWSGGDFDAGDGSSSSDAGSDHSPSD